MQAEDTVAGDFQQVEQQDQSESDSVSEDDFDSDYEDGPNFRFFRKNRERILDDTNVSVRYTQSEIDCELGVPENWVVKKAATKAYIDDLNIVEKVRHCDSISVISEQKQKTYAHAPQSESIFKCLSSRASDLNMKVNEGKTQVVCISAASSANVESYINANTKRISSSDSLKILGFWFGSEPTVDLHIEKLEEKFRARLWSLRHLKRSGMSEDDMMKMFKMVIRPVIDFASMTYHSMLTKEQVMRLERLQMRALKIIFGAENSYNTIIAAQDIPRLAERRDQMFTKFALKCSTNPRFREKWFPLNPQSSKGLRAQNKYVEFPARTERMLKSPLYQMRKRLNQIHRNN